MADLRTSYMGIELSNPIVVGACSLSRQIDTIKEIEAAGAGGLVLKSLFEEQIQLENAELDDVLSQHGDMYAEAVSLFPDVSHGGPKEHLYWTSEARKATEMPLFASLNAVNEEVWVDYARQLAETGVDPSIAYLAKVRTRPGGIGDGGGHGADNDAHGGGHGEGS